MHDSEVVASIAGDRSDGLTEAYDRYADQLYQYSLAALGEPAEADEAVQNTFVIAAAKVSGLREPNRLRAWLYAVARNECQRIGLVFASAYGLDLTAVAADSREDAEHARMRDLLEAADAGLTPGERELIELELRHGLAVDEIAAVIGVSRSQANALASRAREHLEAGLAAVVVARAGRYHCDWLASVLADWDEQLTVPLRTQLDRHIGRCPTCSTRRDLELHPGRLNGDSLGEAMAAAAAASLRAAVGPPDVVRALTLSLAAGQDPDAIAHRDAVLGRAGAFDSDGFPQPAGRDGSGSARRTGRFAVLAGLVAAAVIAAVAVVLIGSSGHGKQSAGPSAAAQLRPVAGTSATSTAGPATRTAPQKTTGSATTAPPATPTAANHATTSAAPPSATTSPTTTTTTPAAKVTPGTLAVSPSGGTLVVPPGGTTISLTAQGGPVTWSSSVSSGSGSVHVRPSGGTVSPGTSVTVTVTASGGANGREVTINPGGTVFTIFISLL